MNRLVGLLEAVIFASGTAIARSEIFDKIPDEYSKKDFNDAIQILQEKYCGDCGIVLEVFNDKLQFASSSTYGEIVSNILQPVKEKELTNILMECLAIIAYRQPITRGEIEEIRGISADYALTTLSRCNMVKQKGYKNSPGHPALFVTSEQFLQKFGLKSLDEMPDYATIMRKLAEGGNFNEQSEGLYRQIELADDFEDGLTSFQEQQSLELDRFIDSTEIPDFLQGEDITEIVGDGAKAVACAICDLNNDNHIEDNSENIYIKNSKFFNENDNVKQNDEEENDAFEEDSDTIQV